MEKLENKLIDMREMYQEYKDPMAPVSKFKKIHLLRDSTCRCLHKNLVETTQKCSFKNDEFLKFLKRKPIVDADLDDDYDDEEVFFYSCTKHFFMRFCQYNFNSNSILISLLG